MSRRGRVVTITKSTRNSDAGVQPITPAAADIERERLRQEDEAAAMVATPLSPLAQQVVNVINPKLARSGQGDAGVRGPAAEATVREVAQRYQTLGWQTKVLHEPGVPSPSLYSTGSGPRIGERWGVRVWR